MPTQKSLLVLIVLILGVSIFFLIVRTWESKDDQTISNKIGILIGQNPKLAEITIPPPPVPSETKPKLEIFEYIEIIEGCGPYHEGPCVNVRSGPGTEYPVIQKLRHGIVLRVSEKIVSGDHTWYKIMFDDWLRYPERVSSDWYVAGDFVRDFKEEHIPDLVPGTSISTNKRILVDRSDQMLYAYEGDTLFMQESVSTGVGLTPTPRGTFTIYKKTPSRYMQGPLQGVSDEYYDLPGVPWNLYFTTGGAVIHGAYWHDKFGSRRSHGCVNLPLDQAKKIYDWAEIGTKVTIQE